MSAPLMLSVSGARGIVGESMTPDVARRFAAAFATHVDARSVVLGRDPRPSGLEIETGVVEGLTGAGADVVRLGVAATPTVGVAAVGRGGMVVTASHNPSQWNGLKCITPEGIAPPEAVAMAIVQRFRNDDFKTGGGGNVIEDATADERHVGRVLDVMTRKSGGLRVVLDSNHGAGARSGQLLLDELGCDVVMLGGEPDGRFEHGLEPTREHLQDLCRVTVDEAAAVGFAQDPDADRLAIVDEKGRYIGEEYTLALAARRVFESRGGGVVVTNLSTSRMIDDLAARHPGARVVRTPVGEANVAESMVREGAILGGEGNGGVILPEVCLIRDSLGSMALVLELLADSGRPLSVLVDEMPAYVMVKRKLEADDGLVERVAERFRGERINTDDGVRIDFDDGWLHLRASNTEPIVRLIAEAPSRQRVDELMSLVDLGS